jgi:hypothetical protein
MLRTLWPPARDSAPFELRDRRAVDVAILPGNVSVHTPGPSEMSDELRELLRGLL